RWECAVRGATPIDFDLHYFDPSKTGGYRLTVRPRNTHCDDVAFSISIKGKKSGKSVNIPCTGACAMGGFSLPRNSKNYWHVDQSVLAPLTKSGDGATEFQLVMTFIGVTANGCGQALPALVSWGG